MAITMRPLTAEDVAEIRPWFADAETQRWVGDETWPQRLFDMVEASGDRCAFVAARSETLVGLADVDRHDDARAAVAVVVAPAERRRGVGRAILEALPRQPELRSVVEFFGGVENGNDASRAMVTRAGFDQVTEGPDHEGFTYFALRTDGRKPQASWVLPGS